MGIYKKVYWLRYHVALHWALEREYVGSPNTVKELREECQKMVGILKRVPDGKKLIKNAKANVVCGISMFFRAYEGNNVENS